MLEFGSRRAQGADAAILGARAAYIGGCAGTACTISDQLYGVPAGGTMAHAWVQMFDSASTRPSRPTARSIPTTRRCWWTPTTRSRSGIPNAIRAFNEVLKPMGITKCGIRLDSGDMAYLTREGPQDARRGRLDRAARSPCPTPWTSISSRTCCCRARRSTPSAWASGSSPPRAEPVFGGVYKLVAVEDEQAEHRPQDQDERKRRPRSPTPHYKKLYRLFANDTGKAIADWIVRLRRGAWTAPGRGRQPDDLRPGRHLEDEDGVPTSPPRSCRCPSS